MATYTQLAAESWWRAEFIPPNMDAYLLSPLRARYPHAEIGAKGDNNHLSGRHRSRNWSLNSRYCTNRGYGTSDARDKRGGGDWIRADDIGITGPTLYDACHRVDAAVRAGRLPGLAEWFGTFDGGTVVGWFQGRPGTSDSSHLWHLHLGWWTEAADDPAQMTLAYQIITGEDIDMAAVIQTTDKDGNTVFVNPATHTFSRVPKPPAGHTGVYYPLDNKLVAYRATGVTVIDGKTLNWQGGYDFDDPANWVWTGVEVKPEGAVTLSDADLAKVTAAAKEGAEEGAPTADELAEAAFEGAQRAERE